MPTAYSNVAETLASAQTVTTALYKKRSPHPMWEWCENISVQLQVHSVAAGAGDSLIVTVYSVYPGNVRAALGTFTTVLGNSVSASILNQIMTLQKSTTLGWTDTIEIEAVPAGGTANFNFSVRIFGS